jgi:cell division GTPase FtsZ
MLVHSLAGGTGSGLGSRLVEAYRDTFGKAYLVSASVWPHSSGETPLQHYNTCFSLSKLQENADACLLFQNENIMRTLSKLVTMKAAGVGMKDHHALNMASTITMKNLNESIVTVLKHVMQPAKEEKFDFSDIMNLASMPVYKMLEANTNPLIFNRQIAFSGEKTWNAVVDGCLS